MTYQYEGDFFNGYDFNSTLSIPISGSGVYNGQAFAGSWNLLIPIDLQVNASTPTSLTFSEENANGATRGSMVVGGTDLVDAIATAHMSTLGEFPAWRRLCRSQQRWSLWR